MLRAGVVLATTAAAGAGAAPAAAAPAASATALSTSQANMLRAGYVRVRVEGRRAGSARVWSTARRTARGRAYRVTRARRIPIRRGRSRVIRLRLNATGRRILRRCASTALAPATRVRRRGSSRSVVLRGSARAVRADTRRCSGPGAQARLAAPDPDPASLRAVATENADRCDFLDPAACLFPWPNDAFTKSAKTPTGRKLNLNSDSVPKNRAGKPIDPTDQNRADGFSPGNMIVTKVPGLESHAAFARTGAVPITDMARTYDRRQPVVVINARTRKRQLIWAEIDSNPSNPADVTLIIRPGRNFDEGERYIVALRNLKKADGKPIAPRDEFRAYRDALATTDPDIERRRAHYEELFRTLARAQIARRDLYLTWDFTVASRQSLSDRALSIRDDAFAKLGDTNLADRTVQGAVPTFVQNPDIDDRLTELAPDVPLFDFKDLDGYREFTPEQNTNTARRITGTITVPCYLDAPGCPPGSSFSLGADGKPRATPGNTTTANVICTVPRKAVDQGPASPQARVSLYGHGLLGSAGEVGGGSAQPFANDQNIVFCATDWIGMSTFDVPNVLTLLQDLSNFRSLVDRSQQGFVNFMYLGRWLSHPQGAAALGAFKVDGRSVIDPAERLVYDGNSQGGILAGGLTALAPDFDRAVHGVPGMNYSTLLRRSVDFDTYANGNFEGVPTGAGLYQSYPDELERPLVLSMMQLLWDRGEANGYAHHMTGDPLPGTPPHQVLLHPAFGDHQVANVAADTEARTIGARAYRPALFAGRSPDVTPLYGVPTAPSAWTGSGIVYWDTGPLRDGGAKGTPAPPTGNVPPRQGNDPHSAPRKDPKSWQQKSAFLRNGGTLINPCGVGPCFADGFTGP